jgi:1-acyl-sn-glycerol-3-phosphate acyltransferase
MVGMFPEGGVRRPANSVFAGGPLQPGFAKLAQVADVPVLPCVVVGGGKLRRWMNWLPLRRTRWAVAFGEPLTLRRELERAAARAALIEDVRRSLAALHEEVRHYV